MGWGKSLLKSSSEPSSIKLGHKRANAAPSFLPSHTYVKRRFRPNQILFNCVARTPSFLSFFLFRLGASIPFLGILCNSFIWHMEAELGERIPARLHTSIIISRNINETYGYRKLWQYIDPSVNIRFIYELFGRKGTRSLPGCRFCFAWTARSRCPGRSPRGTTPGPMSHWPWGSWSPVPGGIRPRRSGSRSARGWAPCPCCSGVRGAWASAARTPSCSGPQSASRKTCAKKYDVIVFFAD